MGARESREPARVLELEGRIRELEAERQATADFFDFMAHELMTPVTSIDSFAFIIGRDTQAGADAIGKRCLEGLTRNSARLVAMIDELLEVGRLRSGRVVPQRARFDLRDVIPAAVAKAEIQAAGARLRMPTAGEPLMVEGDRGRLEDFVAEMVRDCAGRAGKGEEVTLALRVAGGAARLEVRDPGAAVEREVLERAFKGLRRSAGRAERPAGGFGLALGAEVVHRLGGRAGASSDEKGNCLYLELPLRG